MKVLITLPSLNGKGGVANYYNSIMPFLNLNKEFNMSYLEIGTSQGSYNFLHPLYDQIRFFNRILLNKPDLVHVNPSLDLKSFLRDGMFVYLAKIL